MIVPPALSASEREPSSRKPFPHFLVGSVSDSRFCLGPGWAPLGPVRRPAGASGTCARNPGRGGRRGRHPGKQTGRWRLGDLDLSLRLGPGRAGLISRTSVCLPLGHHQGLPGAGPNALSALISGQIPQCMVPTVVPLGCLPDKEPQSSPKVCAWMTRLPLSKSEECAPPGRCTARLRPAQRTGRGPGKTCAFADSSAGSLGPGKVYHPPHWHLAIDERNKAGEDYQGMETVLRRSR